MNRSSALELLEIMETFETNDLGGYGGIRANNEVSKSCLALAADFNGVNPSMYESWLDVADTCSKLSSALWDQIRFVYDNIKVFCKETSYNEQTVIDAVKKTDEASQQALKELGL